MMTTTAPHARVLMICAFFEPGFRGGGPIKSVAGLIDSAPTPFTVALLTQDHDLGDKVPFEGLSGLTVARGRHRVTYVRGGAWAFLSEFRRELSRRPNIVYVNGLWHAVFDIIPVVLAMLSGPKKGPVIVVAPRGQLNQGALAVGSRLKPVVMQVWRVLARSGRVVFHASTELEAAECRTLLRVRGRVVIVSPDPVAVMAPQPIQLAARSTEAGPLRVVFVSRISPKKNLRAAVRALHHVKVATEFKVYGPIEDHNYWNTCLTAAAGLPSNVRFEYGGELRAAEVFAVFGASDVFLFPTLGENFGHVIVESLQAGCPVICGRDTPWGPVLAAGGGVEIDVMDEHLLAQSIEDFANLNAEELAETRVSAQQAFREWLLRRSGSHVFDLAVRAD